MNSNYYRKLINTMLDKKNLLFFLVTWIITAALINYFFPSGKQPLNINQGEILKIEEEKKQAFIKPVSRETPIIDIPEQKNRFLSI